MLNTFSIVGFGLKQSTDRTSVSYSKSATTLGGRNAPTESKFAADPTPAASNEALIYYNYARPGSSPHYQPSVYHSTIEKAALPNNPASPVQTTSTAVGDLNTAAGHHHGHAHGKYYEYREVPQKKTWKFGYKRGNHKHTISRHEHGKAGKHPHFKTKVKWHDKKSKGKGIHLWDYNHHDKKHYHHG